MGIKIKWIKGEVVGRIGVDTPFNEPFKDELKALVPSAKWGGYNNPYWFFDEEAKPDVIPILDKYFGNQVWQRITWTGVREGRISIDGASLVFVSRDYWKFRSDDVTFRVVEQDLSSGGSRNNPVIAGDLVVEALVRPGADIYPEPAGVEEIGEPEKKNPLGLYPADMLAQELIRRGETAVAALNDDEVAAELSRREIKLFTKDQFFEAMTSALHQIFPDSDGKIPEDEQELARKMQRFVRLTRLALEQPSDE